MTYSAALDVYDILKLKGIQNVYVGKTPPGVGDVAVFDIISNVDSIIGNFTYVTIKVKGSSYEQCVDMLGEIEDVVKDDRNIVINGHYYGSMIKTTQPRPGGYDEDIKQKYHYAYQDYKLFRSEV